jgi:hypothetical protein
VTYSDVPEQECQDRVRVQQSNTYEPVPVAGSESAEPDVQTPVEPFTGYVSATISQPASDGTVRSNEGRVPVSLDLQPVLQPGHKVRWVLDGIQIQPSFDVSSAVLTGVERGTHSLSAQVLGEQGAVLYSAGPVSFTLRKASAIKPGG